ncbi:MAG: GMC family oxidoreductase [Gemmatimonadetes bacterium]|nr:GMC family oxidoreductase [Gemmatimonadota bacterium]
MSAPLPFTPAQRATLHALLPALLRGAPSAAESPDALITRCEARLAPLPPHRRAAFGLALDVLGSRLGVMLAIGHPLPGARLSAEAATRALEAWADSALPPLRSAVQSVRRLVLAVHYAHPEVVAAIGYPGPLHLRTPRVPWEGPMDAPAPPAPSDGSPAPRDPVARAPRVLPGFIPPDPLPAGVHTAATLTGDVRRTADAVVIGTGAGGAVTAARLAEAGYAVVMLEGGGYHTRSTFTEDEPALMQALYAEGALRTTDDAAVGMVQGEAVGGSTLVNWMIMLRTPPWVLEQWAREAGVEGMSPAEMAPVFERIEREVHAAEVPEAAHSANNRILLDGARALGWRVTGARINARDCVRCGYCGIGCRHDAKQSTLLTYVPRALAAGGALYADAQVERITVLERDTGRGTPPRKRVEAVVRPRDGARAARQLVVDAPLVVVAGGAVGTPALLERSGLGGGGVGRWLRLHPTTAIFGQYDRPIVTSAGIPLTSMCDEFLRWRGTDYGYWIETPPMLPSFTAGAASGFGPAHAELMARLDQLGVLVALVRDGADRAHSSGRVRVDRRGQVRIDYRLAPEDQRRMRDALVQSAKIHFAAGATQVSTLHTRPLVARTPAEAEAFAAGDLGPNRMALFSAHVNGTCRMGTAPGTAGATPEGERFGVRGLHVADGSLLPTALGVNPQETIMAVASVLAERMAVRYAGVKA